MPYQRTIWSPVEIEYLKREYKVQPINQLTIALAKSRSAIEKKIREIKTGKEEKARAVGGIKSRIGKREDLGGMFFRSKWEANFYRYLILQDSIKKVEYEPHDFTFWQFGIKKGTVSYTPDFRVTFHDGSCIFVEVKGFLKASDKTRIRRFQKYYPEEASQLVAMTGSKNTKAYQFFASVGVEVRWFWTELNKEWKGKIPNWE